MPLFNDLLIMMTIKKIKIRVQRGPGFVEPPERGPSTVYS
jgi:hypothetical protein